MNEQASLNPFDQLLEIDRRSRSRDLPSMTDLALPKDRVGGLALCLGSWNLLFPLEQVSELITVPRITRVPGVKPCLLGIANLRGTVIPIIDLGAYLGGQTTVPTARSRVVVIHAGGWLYGLLVDEIIGMRHFGTETELPNLETVRNEFHECFRAGYRGEGCLWFMFDAVLLLNGARFLDGVAG